MMQYVLSYLLAVNLAAFCMMGLDKHKAVHGQWRISEAALLGIAALGGSVGTLLGMYLFRHKTRRRKFTLGVPALLLVQLVLALLLRR